MLLNMFILNVSHLCYLNCRIFPPPSQSYYCLLKVGSHSEEEGEDDEPIYDQPDEGAEDE